MSLPKVVRTKGEAAFWSGRRMGALHKHLDTIGEGLFNRDRMCIVATKVQDELCKDGTIKLTVTVRLAYHQQMQHIEPTAA